MMVAVPIFDVEMDSRHLWCSWNLDVTSILMFVGMRTHINDHTLYSAARAIAIVLVNTALPIRVLMRGVPL
jgi:hypothetical protein